MEFLFLNASDIKVSRVGFGCCPMGGYGWGNTSEKDFSNAVSAAFELGVNFFDTADVYGLGLSEKRLGQALKYNRKEAVIASKFGVRFDNFGNTFYDNSKNWLEIALNNSLKRLETDYIDLYQVHYSDEKTPLDEVLFSLEQCKKSGKIREYGVTNINLNNLHMNDSSSLATYSFEYSLVNRSNEPMIKEINKKNDKLLFVTWGSLGQGILSGKYFNNTQFSGDDRRSRGIYKNFHEKFYNNLKIINDLRKMQLKYYPDKTVSQMAIRWILDAFPFSVALVGTKKSEQIIDIAKSSGWQLDKSHLELLDLSTRLSDIQRVE